MKAKRRDIERNAIGNGRREREGTNKERTREEKDMKSIRKWKGWKRKGTEGKEREGKLRDWEWKGNERVNGTNGKERKWIGKGWKRREDNGRYGKGKGERMERSNINRKGHGNKGN